MRLVGLGLGLGLVGLLLWLGLELRWGLWFGLGGNTQEGKCPGRIFDRYFGLDWSPDPHTDVETSQIGLEVCGTPTSLCRYWIFGSL